MRLTISDERKVARFISKYPFYQIYLNEDPLDKSQIVGVNFASSEILLRDFVWWDAWEVALYFSFSDKKVNKEWNKLIKKIKFLK